MAADSVETLRIALSWVPAKHKDAPAAALDALAARLAEYEKALSQIENISSPDSAVYEIAGGALAAQEGDTP